MKLCGLVILLVVGKFTAGADHFHQNFGDRGIDPLAQKASRFKQDLAFDPEKEHMLDDMIISNEIHKRLFETDSSKRNAVVDRSNIWKNKTVYYYIDDEYDESHRAVLYEGISMIENKTCVKFVELKGQHDHKGNYVHIKSEAGCYARVGSNCFKNVCEMSLQIPHCLRAGIVAHEFLHVLGFFHMQCSAGRNDYIEIKWNNIYETMRKNFYEYTDVSTLLETTYDYDSITHYGEKFFSINGDYTIITKDKKFQEEIGQRDHLSEGDILRIQRLYECDEVM